MSSETSSMCDDRLRKFEDVTDLREQLVNDRKTGPIAAVSLPDVMITRLHGIMLDIDHKLFRDEWVGEKAREDVDTFATEVVLPMLRRHPVMDAAEVRASGGGLHVLIWFDEAVEFTTDAERQRWAAVVKALQCVLPTDPDAPGITAMTRPLGSINGKNGATVRTLKLGTQIPSQAVLELFAELKRAPFRTITSIVLGGDAIAPCPVCRGDDTKFSALDRHGICYGRCGKITLARIFDLFLNPRDAKKEA